jgi:hypothetical protein
MTNEELVEKAARLLGAGDPLPSEYELARAVVNMVLEEAAKYHDMRAAELRNEIRRNRDYSDYCGQLIVSKGEHEDSAKAIRAMKSEPPK